MHRPDATCLLGDDWSYRGYPHGERSQPSLATLELRYSEVELTQYTGTRLYKLSPKSQDWIQRASQMFWDFSKGAISQKVLNSLYQNILEKYKSKDSWNKVLNFVRAYLKHLSRLKLDSRYQQFTLFLEPPKSLKERKTITSRIVTREDIENVAVHITSAYRKGELDYTKFMNHVGIVLFGAYTGQRVEATIDKLTVGQARMALHSEAPVLQVAPDQDKIRMEHYVPIHPDLRPILEQLILHRDDGERLFHYMSYQQWIKRNKVTLSRTGKHFVSSDTRKFAEQYGDIIQWDQSNRAYILTHGVSGVDWGHYKHPLPEFVYQAYMKYWADTCLVPPVLESILNVRTENLSHIGDSTFNHEAQSLE